MQLNVIHQSFQNAEDQLFATNKFCEYFKNKNYNNLFEGLQIIFVDHTPQNGLGTKICKAKNTRLVFNLFEMQRENYCIEFNIKPALTNEELIEFNVSQRTQENN